MSPHTVAVGNGCTLLCGDNSDLIASLPASYALVSDPPYGIAYKHGGGSGKSGKQHHRVNTTAIIGDDKPFDPTPLLRFDSVTVFGANHYFHRLPETGSLHAWDKRGGSMRGPDDSFADVEFIWTKARCKSRCFPYLWKGVCREKGESGQRSFHQSQKPIALMRWVIQHFTPPGAAIFDPYMGSGSTGIAALLEGRQFFGAELDPDHFATAERRIREAHDRIQAELTLTA